MTTAHILGTTSESNLCVGSEEGWGEPSTAINCVWEEKWPYFTVNLRVRERSNHHLPPPSMALFEKSFHIDDQGVNSYIFWGEEFILILFRA